MLAVALNPAVLTIGGAVVLGVVALVLAGGATYGVVRYIRNRKAARANGSPVVAPKAAPLPGLPGLLGNLGSVDLANLPPEVKQVINVLLPAVHQAQQTVVNAAVARMFPWAAPFIPGIDRAIGGIDSIIDNKLGLGGSLLAVAPGQPATLPLPPIHIQPGTRLHDLLLGLVEAEKKRAESGK